MPRPTHVTIDLDALAHNARITRRLTPGKRLMACVKADAYGHGAVPCAQTLAPLVDAFAVAHAEEAHNLRDAGISLPILVLEGPFDVTDAKTIGDLALWTVVHSDHQLPWVIEHLPRENANVWLKLDTGMHRLGIQIDTLPAIWSQLLEAGFHDPVLMTHLAFAEQGSSELTRQQANQWREALASLPSPTPHTSALNSAAIIGELPISGDWVRPGYMLYGGLSANGPTTELRPVMSLRSEVMAVRHIPQGDSVGYGGRWIAPRPSRIATVPVGYGDGYPRHAANGAPVWIEGQECPLIGRVSMDMVTVDITDHPNATIGSAVELWGQHIGIDRLAQAADTIGYTLMTQISSRPARQWTGG